MSGIPDSLAGLKVSVDDLHPYGKNPRVGDVDAIAESLEVNGQYRPVVVNARTNEVLAGNHTLKAARRLGWTEIAATFVDADEEQATRIALVDNRANDVAGYDDDLLAALLTDLGPGHLEGTGFSDADLAEILAGVSEDPVSLTDPDSVPALPTEPVSQAGDVWQLGPHRVLCGDSTDAAAVTLMLEGDRPDCVWTDPPYGVSYVGGTADALTIQNDDKDGLPELLAGAFSTLAAVCRPGAAVYVAYPEKKRVVFETAMLEAGLVVRQNLIWVKNAMVLGGSDYHYKHESVLYGFTGGASGRLGRGGGRWQGDDKQTSVFEVPSPSRSAEHPTMKPTELIEAMVANSCRVGGIALDLFGGSGSTLIAAHRLRMRARLVELDPRYVDVTCRRYQEHTGVVPTREGAPHDFAA